MEKRYCTSNKSRMWRKFWHTTNVQKAFRNFQRYCQRKKKAEKLGAPAPKFKGLTKDSLIRYVDIANRFGLYCRREHGASRLQEMKTYYFEYISKLIAEGYSPWTIQTYVVAICFVLGCERPDFALPPRRAAMAKKGRRDLSTKQGWQDLKASAGNLFEILQKIGIRHREYVDLTRDCLVEDESGVLCILVKKGKGGKCQQQRILPGDEKTLLLLFDGNSQKKVFSATAIDRISNLHVFRRIYALRAYRYYEKRLQIDQQYRQQLIREIIARWQVHNGNRKIPMRDLYGEYIIAGMNRKLAEFYHYQMGFDRLAVMAVTVFHLSHWRVNVAINSYLLPTLQEEAGVTNGVKELRCTEEG